MTTHSQAHNDRGHLYDKGGLFISKNHQWNQWFNISQNSGGHGKPGNSHLIGMLGRDQAASGLHYIYNLLIIIMFILNFFHLVLHLSHSYIFSDLTQ